MYKYINAYKLGYDEGIKDAYLDFINNIRKEFKEIDDMKVMSFLYDIGYIEGYRKFINFIFNLN